MEDRVLAVKYELYYEGVEDRLGKTDRVDVGLELDAEIVAIAFREAVHERRKVRDLAHCSAANLRIFPESSPDEELQDDDFLRFLLDGAPEKIRVVAPPAPKGLASPHPGSSQYLGTNRSKSIGSAGRSSAELFAGVGTSGPSSRRESSGPKRESESVVVFVKTGDATFPIEVEKTASVEAVKARIKEQEQIPLDQQRLIYGGVELEPGRTLQEYNIHQGSELQLVLTLDPSQI